MKNLLTLLFLTTCLCVAHAQSSIEFSVNPHYSYRYLGTSDDASELVKSVRNESEKPELNLSYSILVNRQITKNWFLQSGIRWANLGYLVKELDDLRWPSEHDGNGSYVPDPLLSNSLKLSEDNIFIEVPLQLRYEFLKAADKKISFYVQAGLSPNIYLTTRITQELDDNKTITHRKNDLFRTVHLSTQVAAGLTYRMNKQLAGFIQPSFKYHLTAIADAPVKEHLYAAGIDIGLRWYLK